MAKASRSIEVKQEFEFNWTGRDKHGRPIEGKQRAANQAAVKAILSEQGIKPIRVVRSRSRRRRGGKIKTADIMFFSRQMKTMISAGIPISDAIGMQAASVEKLSMRNLLLELRAFVDRGDGLTGALNQYPKNFSPMYRGLVHVGEQSGVLETVFDQLATFLEKSESTRKTIKKALIYPIAVIVIALTITALILIKVVPVFKDMFEQAGQSLPAPTQIVINLSNFIQTPTFLVSLVVAAGLIFGLRHLIKQNQNFRREVHKFLLRLPLIGKLSRLNNSAIFSRTLATMYDSGSPMLSALTTVAGALPNEIFKESTLQIRENVAIGQELNFAMRQSELFPELVTHMVGIGEKSGNLSEMLFRVSENYEEDVDNTIAGLMTLIEPLLIVVLGVLVGGILIAMYMPLFSMGDVI